MKEYYRTQIEKSAAQVNFELQTPKLLICREQPDSLYEKAFLSPHKKHDCEYCLNTTVWD